MVASLALSVALTVMVASFRDARDALARQVLPADLYVRSAGQQRGRRPGLPADRPSSTRWRALPGVARVEASRVRALQLDPARPRWR